MLKLLPTSASPTRRYQFPRGWVCSRTSVPQSRWSWVPCCTFGSLVARSCTGLTTIVQYITTLIYESINILLWLLMLHSLWYMISFDTQIFNFKCVVWLVIFSYWYERNDGKKFRVFQIEYCGFSVTFIFAVLFNCSFFWGGGWFYPVLLRIAYP